MTRRSAHPQLAIAVALVIATTFAASGQEPFTDREGIVNELDTARLGAALQEPLEGQALDQATAGVATKMRCPVCQGMSIAASPSAMAVAMSEQVRELLSLGYTEEQVWDYFEGSYGEFVRLEPKKQGLNWLVWLVPPIGILLGALVVIGFQRSQKVVEDAEPEPQDEHLERLLERVRSETRS